MTSPNSCADDPALGQPDADLGQAEHFLRLLTDRRNALATEIEERRTELDAFPLQARNSERARNIRRLIQMKNREIAELDDLCTALITRAYRA